MYLNWFFDDKLYDALLKSSILTYHFYFILFIYFRMVLVCEFEGEVIIITAHSDSELVAQGGPEPNLSDIQLGYSHVVVVVVGRNPTSVSPTPLSEHPWFPRIEKVKLVINRFRINKYMIVLIDTCKMWVEEEEEAKAVNWRRNMKNERGKQRK